MNNNYIKTLVNQILSLHKNKFIVVLEIFLLGVFSLIEWKLDNRFFAIFLIVFFIAALLLQNQRYLIFIIPILIVFLIFNTLLVDCLILIKNVSGPTIQHPKSAINTFFEQNAGLDVLPIPVQNMLSMIEDTQIENYQLSPEFLKNDEIVQRIVEGAWPIKMEGTSPNIFINTDETSLYKNCAILADSEDLTLVDCN